MASGPDPSHAPARAVLARRLGLGDAVVLGLGAMLGAGVFAAFTPAAAAAGSGLVLGLVIAAVVAYCNATSSARLAALYPESGGTYVYGRERLGAFWGYLAGWGFVVGKTASCAAMALTVGSYTWSQHPRTAAVAAVVALTALNYFGVHRSALLTRVLVALVLSVLLALAAGALASADVTPSTLFEGRFGGPHGVLQAAGFLFFAFAGYARIATLGEEVRNPGSTIPRAVRIALAIILATYLVVAVSLVSVLGVDGVARAPDAVATAAARTRWAWLEPTVRVGAAVAALGSLLALILGVSRTVLAMARDGHLPTVLAAVHPRYVVPSRAQLVVGAVTVVAVLAGDVGHAIAFSSFAVLVYYGIANASALTLPPAHGTRVVPCIGLGGCLVVSLSLPLASTLSGGAVLAAGVVWWLVRGALGRDDGDQDGRSR